MAAIATNARRRGRLLRAAVVVAAAVAVGAPPAGAREVFEIHGERLNAPYLRPFYDEGGPVLLSGGVAFLDFPGRRAHVLYRPAGGPPRTLPQFQSFLSRPGPRHWRANVVLAGDRRRLALGREDEDPFTGVGNRFAAVVAASLYGPRRTLAHCTYGVTTGLQMDGPVVEFLGPARPPCHGGLLPRAYDLKSGKVFDIPALNGTDPQIAGRYAIWEDEVDKHGETYNRSVVYDFRAHRQVHRTRELSLEAIARDGTVIGVDFDVPGKPIDYECRDLVTYTVADPAPRTLPYRSCQPYLTRVARKRIVFLAPPPGRPEEGPRQRLMLGDTSGAPAVPLTEAFATDRALFDFDGTRLVYPLYRCNGARLLAVDEVKTALKRGPIRTLPCGAEIGVPAGPVGLARGFDLSLRCPRGCAGAFHVRSGRRKWKLIAPGALPLGPGRHTVKVRAPTAKRATGNQTDEATLDFAVRQPDGQSETYTAPIQIRRPG